MITTIAKSTFERVLDPIAACFTPDVARQILDVTIDPSEQARVDVLADRANEGLLTDAERKEYEEFIHAADIIGIIKGTARLALAQPSRK